MSWARPRRRRRPQNFRPWWWWPVYLFHAAILWHHASVLALAWLVELIRQWRRRTETIEGRAIIVIDRGVQCRHRITPPRTLCGQHGGEA